MACAYFWHMNQLKSLIILSILLFLLLISFFTGRLQAQEGITGDFRLMENDGKILLHWVIREGNTCDGVRVYRSADGSFFQEIGRIEGICGSPFSAVAYDFTDSLPLLNQLAYYRLELGNLGFSATLSIFLPDLSGQNYRVVPNPASDAATIYFENPLQQDRQITLFSLSGERIYQLQTNGSDFKLLLQWLKPGIYLFMISDVFQKNLIKGKLLHI